MTLFKYINGQRLQVTAAEENTIRDEWAVNSQPPTIEEIEAEIEREVASITDAVADRDKALAFLMADFWLYISTGKTPNQATQQEIRTARQQVRNRLQSHLRDIKGL